ncbi:uncharacterized protein [Ptychodera flava]|uniref:uncharacterized protein n=1 Tax=Ptychodera flava TaxID=63121 RepID=UPI00396A7E2E
MADGKPVVKVIQNINEVIKKWALRGKDNQDKYVVEITKNTMEFIQVGDIKYRPIKKMIPSPNNPKELIMVPGPDGDKSEAAPPEERSRTVHTTSFSNNTTAETQHHHFRVERTSTTSYSWSMTSGHTFSCTAGVSLAPPQVCVAASVEFCKSTDEWTEEVNAAEETRTNVIESDVVVPRGKRVNLNLNITEEDYIARYEVEYRIQGKVHVVIKKGDKLEDRAGEAQDVFKGMDGFEVFPKTSNQKGFAKFVNKGVFMSKREIKQELEMYDEDL